MILAYVLACVAAPDEALHSSTSRFGFAVIADPHVNEPDGDRVARLDAAVDRINAEIDARELAFVLVVGDVGWGEGLPQARASLDRLLVPYVPINGDNEIQLGAEQAFDQAFATHYESLATELGGFVSGPVEVENTELGVTSWFHNVAFSHEGVRFVGLDWASRVIDPVYGEMGELHDFEGGSWPFFAGQLAAQTDERVVLFSHIPMHVSAGGFSVDELDRVAAVTAPMADRIWANFAGHYHGDGVETVSEAGYDLYVTDATWDDANTVRFVDVDAQASELGTATVAVE